MDTPEPPGIVLHEFALSPQAQAALVVAYSKRQHPEADTFSYAVRLGATAAALLNWPTEQNILQLQGIDRVVEWPRFWPEVRYIGPSRRSHLLTAECAQAWYRARNAYGCSCQTDETVATRVITLGVAIMLAARFRDNAKVEMRAPYTAISSVIKMTAPRA